jgi:transposase InsO family protein
VGGSSCWPLEFGLTTLEFARTPGKEFTAVFDEVLAGNGMRIIKTPVRSPRANSFAERYVGTVRRECLDHLLIHGERHFRRILPSTRGITTNIARTSRANNDLRYVNPAKRST